MKLAIGDRVAYSVQFLRSIGMSHSDMAAGRGKVTELKPLGSITLVGIEWEGNQELPARVALPNLAKVGPNTRFCAC